MVTVVCIVFAVIIISIVATKELYDFNMKKNSKLSFGKTFKTTGTPIITLKDSAGKQLNFLVDTGSNLSHLKSGVVEGIADAEPVSLVDSDGNEMKAQGITTANGEVMPDEYYRLTLFCGEMTFTDVFEVFDMGGALDGWGVEIHGIIGNTFLDKYKYVIDFKDKKMFMR